MKSTTEFWLIIIGIIIVLVAILGATVVGSQYMLEKYKSENPRPVCNETTNETITACFELNNPGNYSRSVNFIYFGGII